VAYVFSAMVVVRQVRAWFRPAPASERGLLDDRDAKLLVAWLLTAAMCVQLGNRFFAHYYLMMLPPLAGVVGIATAFFVRTRSRVWRTVGAVLLLAIVVDRLVLFDPGRSHRPFLTFYLLAGAGVLLFFLLRPGRRAGLAVAAWVVLECLGMVVRQQLADTPRSMSHNLYDFTRITRYLEQRAEPGDRLFVWGWAPELYSLTRLESASHVTTVEYVVNDFRAAPPPPSVNEWWAAQMMEDLEARRPRFIVDAAERSWTSTERWIYRLDNYPDLALIPFLERYYRRPVRVDGFRVYERRGPRPDRGGMR
jgi:hypothetical protein